MIFFWFLLVLSIPVLVHLFSFRRARKLYFSNLKFITKVATQSKSRSQLKHYLILTSRLLSFLLLLLFYYQSKEEASANQFISEEETYIDRTESMFVEHRSNRAIDEAEQVLKELNLKEINDGYSDNPFVKYPNIISDFQGINEETLQQLVSDTSIQRNFMLVGQINEYKNAYIDSASFQINPDDISQLRIQLFPKTSEVLVEESLVFRLLKEGRQLSSVVNEASKLTNVTFDIPFDLNGNFVVEISGDEVYYDNEFRFVIPPKAKPGIYLIEYNESYAYQVFANEDLFELESNAPNALDYELMNQSDVILLNGVENLPSGVTSLFKDKTIITFPPAGPASNWEVEWTGINLNAQNDTSKYEMDIDTQHPLLASIFQRKLANSNAPVARSFYQLQGNYEVIIALRDGSPLLVKSTTSNHYIFNTALDLEHTNLPVNSIFLPLLYRIAFSAVQSDNQNYYYPGDIAFLDITEADVEQTPRIVAEELEIIPEFNPTDNGLAFAIPELEPGFYTLINNQDTSSFAVNTPRDESITRGLSLDKLQENLSNLKHVTLQTAGNYVTGLGNQQVSIWKYALILICIVLLTETLLHKYLK